MLYKKKQRKIFGKNYHGHITSFLRYNTVSNINLKEKLGGALRNAFSFEGESWSSILADNIRKNNPDFKTEQEFTWNLKQQ